MDTIAHVLFVGMILYLIVFIVKIANLSNPVKSDCGHKFHYNCISRWLIGHITCPLCNQEWVNERYI